MINSDSSKFFVIDLDLYSAHVLISVKQDQEEMLLSLVEHGVVTSVESPKVKMYMEPFMDMKPTTLARTIMYDNGVIAVKFNYFVKDSIDSMVTLAHELSHVCMYTFERIGMPHTSDTDEAYSYLLGFLTKKFFENIR